MIGWNDFELIRHTALYPWFAIFLVCIAVSILFAVYLWFSVFVKSFTNSPSTVTIITVTKKHFFTRKKIEQKSDLTELSKPDIWFHVLVQNSLVLIVVIGLISANMPSILRGVNDRADLKENTENLERWAACRYPEMKLSHASFEKAVSKMIVEEQKSLLPNFLIDYEINSNEMTHFTPLTQEESSVDVSYILVKDDITKGWTFVYRNGSEIPEREMYNPLSKDKDSQIEFKEMDCGDFGNSAQWGNLPPQENSITFDGYDPNSPVTTPSE